MITMETMIYCHCLARFLYIDLHILFKGGDTLAIRTLMDSDSCWDSTGELSRFLGDLRVPALRSAGGTDSSIIANPNSWLADKRYQDISDLGSAFLFERSCIEHIEDKIG